MSTPVELSNLYNKQQQAILIMNVEVLGVLYAPSTM